MELKPAEGAANINSIGGVDTTGATTGDVLVYTAGVWDAQSPDTGDLVTKSGVQTITGAKTFTDHLFVGNEKELRLGEAGSAQWVALKAPNAITSSLTFTLPSSDGSANQLLRTNGAGVLSFSGLVAADMPSGVALLAGRSGGQILQGGTSASETLTLESTASATKSEVRVASGSPLAMPSQNEVRFYENVSNGTEYVAVKGPASAGSSFRLLLPTTTPTTGQILTASSQATAGSPSLLEIQLGWATPGASTTHASLAGLTADDHLQYVAKDGRSGGQTIYGGTGSADYLILRSNAGATTQEVRIEKALTSESGGILAVMGGATDGGKIRLYQDTDLSSNYTEIRPSDSAQSGTIVYKLPSAYAASDGHVLKSTTGGVLSWAAESGGSGSITVGEVDGSPLLVGCDTIKFDQSDGFVCTNPSGNIIQVDLSSVPVSKLANGTAYYAVCASGAGAAQYGVLDPRGGGTGFASYTTGDLLYASASTTLAKRAIGSQGQILGVNSSLLPAWQEPVATDAERWRLYYDSSVLKLKATGYSGGAAAGVININGRAYKYTTEPASGTASAMSLTTTGGVGSTGEYYIYAYDSSGTLTLEASPDAPTNISPDGVMAKSTDATRRYVGRATVTAGPVWSPIGVYSAHPNVGNWFSSRNIVNDFRLSSDGTNPCPADSTSFSTIYLTPYTGDRMALWNSVAGDWEVLHWDSTMSSQPSLSLSGLTSGNVYDVFAYSEGGLIRLETLVWSSANVRGTGLVRYNGVLCKSGDKSRRYLGTFRATGTTTTADADEARLLWNYYNRVDKYVEITDVGDYATSTNIPTGWSAYGATNLIEYVVGVIEDYPIFNLTSQLKATVAGVSTAAQVGLLWNTSSGTPGSPTCYNAGTEYIQSSVSERPTSFSVGYNYASVRYVGYAANDPDYVFMRLNGAIRG